MSPVNLSDIMKEASKTYTHNIVEINIKDSAIYKMIMAIPDFPQIYYYDLFTKKIVEKEEQLVQPSVIEFTWPTNHGLFLLPDPWVDMAVTSYFDYFFLYDADDNIHIIINDTEKACEVMNAGRFMDATRDFIQYHIMLNNVLEVSGLQVVTEEGHNVDDIELRYKDYKDIELKDMIYNMLQSALNNGIHLHVDTDKLKHWLFPLLGDHIVGIQRLLKGVNTDISNYPYFPAAKTNLNFDNFNRAQEMFGGISIGSPFSIVNTAKIVAITL